MNHARFRSQGTQEVVIGVGLLLLGLVIALSFRDQPLIGSVVCAVVGNIAGRHLIDARRLLARSAAEIRRADQRPPVLLLRSFRDDNADGKHGWKGNRDPLLDRTFEEDIVALGSKLGPVVALQRASDEAPPSGAAREYVDDAVWTTRFADLVDEAAVVLFVIGVTPSLAWELCYLRARGRLGSTLLVFPAEDLADRRRRWQSFVAGLGNSFALPTEDEAVAAHAIHLGDNSFTLFGSGKARNTRVVDAVYDGLRSIAPSRLGTTPRPNPSLRIRPEFVLSLACGAVAALIAGSLS